MYNTLKYHIGLIVIDNFTMFKRQIKNFRKFLEKVALRAILGYHVLNTSWGLGKCCSNVYA